MYKNDFDILNVRYINRSSICCIIFIHYEILWKSHKVAITCTKYGGNMLPSAGTRQWNNTAEAYYRNVYIFGTFPGNTFCKYSFYFFIFFLLL